MLEVSEAETAALKEQSALASAEGFSRIMEAKPAFFEFLKLIRNKFRIFLAKYKII